MGLILLYISSPFLRPYINNSAGRFLCFPFFSNRCAIILLLPLQEKYPSPPHPKTIRSHPWRLGKELKFTRQGAVRIPYWIWLFIDIHPPRALPPNHLCILPLGALRACISSAPAVARFHSSPNTIVMHYRWTPYRCMAGLCCVAAPRCTYCLACLLVCWWIYICLFVWLWQEMQVGVSHVLQSCTEKVTQGGCCYCWQLHDIDN